MQVDIEPLSGKTEPDIRLVTRPEQKIQNDKENNCIIGYSYGHEPYQKLRPGNV